LIFFRFDGIVWARVIGPEPGLDRSNSVIRESEPATKWVPDGWKRREWGVVYRSVVGETRG
jgi:hypothetical protein